MGGQIDVIYTDLEKAFDKVPYQRLVKKLKFYKVNPDIIVKEVTPQRDDVIKSCDVVLYDSLI